MPRGKLSAVFGPIAASLLALAALLVACGGDDGDSTRRTNVDLAFSEWEIALDPAEVPAGEVTFDLTNDGEIPHNLVIVKSDLPPAELPRDGEAVDKAKLNVEGAAGPIAPGPPPEDNDGYTLALSPGKYVLFCDVVAGSENHYRNGMYASLLVNP